MVISLSFLILQQIGSAQVVIERCRSASNWLCEVDRSHSRPPEPASESSLQLEQNRAALKTFVETLTRLLENDSERLAWLAEGFECYVSSGHRRLNDGTIELAVEDLFTAIELMPQHGIALALAGIAAVRTGDAALQQKVAERYRSAPKRLILDLCEVGRWYSRPLEPATETSLQLEQNWAAFKTFLRELAGISGRTSEWVPHKSIPSASLAEAIKGSMTTWSNWRSRTCSLRSSLCRSTALRLRLPPLPLCEPATQRSSKK
jgi:hypothetical protein